MAASAVLVLAHNDGEIVLGRLVGALPDLVVVDALARLGLVAKRLGCSLALRDVTDDLGALLWLAGLDPLFRDLRGQAEGGEDLGVQEVVERRDPSVDDL